MTEIHKWMLAQGKEILQRHSSKQIRSLVRKYGSPLLLLSLKKVREQYQLMQQLLPQVKHHYAIKSNPNPEIVRTISRVDGLFDLASAGEIDILKSQKISPTRCIYTHPIKRPQDMEYAINYGVSIFVFENEYELIKLKKYRNKIKLLLRVSFSSAEAQCDFSSKFGAPLNKGVGLIKLATQMGFDVTGISFHVGSQISIPNKHVEAITLVRQVFDEVLSSGIKTLKIIDIGGGWPVPYTLPIMPITEFIKPISDALDKYFPSKSYQVLSEPGRFISAPSTILLTSVMGKGRRDGTMMYYLDDGIYNSYSGMLFDHAAYLVFSLKALENHIIERQISSLAGPTCDSVDILYQNIMMPDMSLGDILISPMMGSYAGSSHPTDFNHFKRPDVIITEY